MSVMELQGRARRVPPAGDPLQALRFRSWLEYRDGLDLDPETGGATVNTMEGRKTAYPGAWIIRDQTGALHITRPEAGSL